MGHGFSLTAVTVFGANQTHTPGITQQRLNGTPEATPQAPGSANTET